MATAPCCVAVVLERLSKVFSFIAHEVPAKSERSAFFSRKPLLGDTTNSM